MTMPDVKLLPGDPLMNGTSLSNMLGTPRTYGMRGGDSLGKLEGRGDRASKAVKQNCEQQTHLPTRTGHFS